MFDSLSFRIQFAIAPFICVALTLVIYFSHDHVIRSNMRLINNINEMDLVHIGEIYEIIIDISEVNNELTSLLLLANSLDEEYIYVEGKKRLNQLQAT